MSNILSFAPSNSPFSSSFTQVYNSPPVSNIVGSSSFSTSDCGYQGDIGWSAPKNQIVSISDSLESPGIIYALLNKPFSFSTSSEWQSYIPAAAQSIDNFVQADAYLVGQKGVSLYNQYTSRRIWRGTSALRISLDLYFYAAGVTTTYNEVLEACIRLQRLALPTYSGTTILTAKLLSPPGPDPFSTKTQNGSTATGEIINISIGSLMTFSSVIVKEINVTFDQKYDQNGYPLSANATIIFETYQLLTKEDLSGYITPNLPGATTGSATANPNPNFPSSNG
jgi:hypothetical protein